jgi:hypothetical protein
MSFGLENGNPNGVLLQEFFDFVGHKRLRRERLLGPVLSVCDHLT